jgi:hypothetical protein
MNYQKHYDALVERAKCRTLSGYSERHHIVPKCLGGSNESSNLVRLTAEEHFVAHQLLAKIHPDNDKLIYAACLMTVSPHNARVTNKLYSWLKVRLARTQSERFSGKTWTSCQNESRSTTVKELWKNPEFRSKAVKNMAGKTWSEERRLAKSESMRGKPGRVWTAEQKAKLSSVKRQQHLLKGAVV